MFGNEKVNTDSDVLARLRRLSSRVVSDTDKSYAEKHNATSKDSQKTAFQQMNSVANLSSERQKAARAILKTTPDVGRAIAIITGLAVCPTGGTRAKLNFNLGRSNDALDENGNLTRIIDKIEDYFTNILDIETTQYRRLYDILSVEGAKITAILPDNTVDSIINSCDITGTISLESLYRKGVIGSASTTSDGALDLPSLGLLGGGQSAHQSTSLESAFSTKPLARKSYNSSLITNDGKTYIDVIDNPDILKIPTLLEFNNNSKIGIALESYAKSNLKQKETELHPNYHLRRKYKASPQVAIANPASYEGEGRPILIDIPANVFTPVYYPGDPNRRYGGFVLLDEFGSPLTNQTDDETYQQITSRANTGSAADGALKRLDEMGGGQFSVGNLTMDSINRDNLKLFQEMMEGELKNRLTHGAGSANYNIGDDEVFYRIMLSRALAKKRTRILFIPEKMLSYQAVHLDEHGIGISMVAKNRLISTIRTVLFFSNFMGALSNSIQRKKVRLKLDPSERNINRTVETAIGEIINSQASVSDVLNSQGPVDTIDALQRAAVSVEIDDSDIAGMPQTKISMEDERRQIQEIDTSYMEELRKLQMMDYSISPETVDGSFTPQFAAQVYRENDITARMISEIVDATSQYNTEFVRKYIELDPVLVKELMLCVDVRKHKKDSVDPVEINEPEDEDKVNIVSGTEDYEIRLAYVQRALDLLWVSPPNPELDGLEYNHENFENFMKAMESVVDAKLNDTFGRGLRGDMGDTFELLKSTLKQRYINSYLRRSDMLPEIREELTDDKRLHEILEEEIKNLDSFLPLLEKGALLLARTQTGLERKTRLEEDEVNKKYDDIEKEIEEEEEARRQLEEEQNNQLDNEDDEIITPDEPTDDEVTEDEDPEVTEDEEIDLDLEEDDTPPDDDTGGESDDEDKDDDELDFSEFQI